MRKIYFLLMTTIISLHSCSSINDLHYFKDKINTTSNIDGKAVSNYYRVKIRGFSFLSSSRYLSGYFDQDAINLYFNEIAQPENAKIFSKKSAGNDSPLITSESGNELVLILSTNSKAFTDKIGGIVKNQTILNSLAHIAQKSKIEEALKFENDLSKTNEDIQKFILNADIYLEKLSEKTDDEQKLALKQFIYSLN